MTYLSGPISLDDGPATIAAEHAQYDMDSETVTVPGTVLVKWADGYSIDAQWVAVNLKTRSLSGDGGVEGTLNIGRFSANELYADLDQRIVRLSIRKYHLCRDPCSRISPERRRARTTSGFYVVGIRGSCHLTGAVFDANKIGFQGRIGGLLVGARYFGCQHLGLAGADQEIGRAHV